MSDREALLAFLFDRSDKKVLNVKFFRGKASDLTVDQLCQAALAVVKDTWENEGSLEDAPPLTDKQRIAVSAIV